MTIITLERAGQDIAELIRRARSGEEIVIAANGALLAKIVPIAAAGQPRQPGGMKGQLDLPDSFFFDPLPEEEMKLWAGEGQGPQ